MELTIRGDQNSVITGGQFSVYIPRGVSFICISDPSTLKSLSHLFYNISKGQNRLFPANPSIKHRLNLQIGVILYYRF
jgi:hypothetical protein